MSTNRNPRITEAVAHYLALPAGSKWGLLKEVANRFGVSRHSIMSRITRMKISK